MVTQQVLAAVLTQLERMKSGRYFGGLYVYWCGLTLGGLCILYSKIRLAVIQVMINHWLF